MNPFDFVNAINHTKKDLIKTDVDPEYAEKEYVPFLVNKALSYFPDTILYANEVNRSHHIDNKLQYHYLLNSIRSQKRYASWVKKEQDSEDFLAVKEYFGYNNEKTHQALSLLSNEQLKTIKERIQKGG